MIIVDDLKYASHKPSSKHMLAILIILPRHALLLMIYLRWDYNSLLDPGADELLHLVMAFINSSLENGGHSFRALSENSLRILILTWWFCARLNVEWRVCQRLLISRYRQLLYLMASMAERFLFLTQFISSQGPLTLFNISGWKMNI